MFSLDDVQILRKNCPPSSHTFAQKTGFSVAFGSTERSGSAGRRAPFAPLRECQLGKWEGLLRS